MADAHNRVVDVRYRRGATQHGEREMDAAGRTPTAGRLGSRARTDLVNSGVLNIRDRTPADIPFITNSWLKSYRDAVPYVGNDVYFANHHAIIERLWAAPGVVWLVATSAKFPTYIFGYLVGEATDRGPVVHYVYVRHEVAPGEPLRRQGVAKRMLETFFAGQDTSTIWYTHTTPAARAALSGRHRAQPGMDGWEYNPYLLWTKLS